MVVHICNLSTWKVEEKGFRVRGQPKTVSKNKKRISPSGLCPQIGPHTLHSARPVWSDNHDTLEFFSFCTILRDPTLVAAQLPDLVQKLRWRGAGLGRSFRVTRIPVCLGGGLGGGLSGGSSAAGELSFRSEELPGCGARLRLRQEEWGPW